MTRDKRNRHLAEISSQIRALVKGTNANIATIGGLLERAANEVCEHGEYIAWLSRDFSWSYRTALRYRRVYTFKCANLAIFDKLNLSQTALYLVADPYTTEPARQAIIEAALKGPVSHADAKKIINPPPPPLPPDDGGDGEIEPPTPIDDDAPPRQASKFAEAIGEMIAFPSSNKVWWYTKKQVGQVNWRCWCDIVMQLADRSSSDEEDPVKAKADRAEAMSLRKPRK